MILMCVPEVLEANFMCFVAILGPLESEYDYITHSGCPMLYYVLLLHNACDNEKCDYMYD